MASGLIRRHVKALATERVGPGLVRYAGDARTHRLAAAALVERAPVVAPRAPDWLVRGRAQAAARRAALVRGRGAAPPDIGERLGLAKKAKAKKPVKDKKAAAGGGGDGGGGGGGGGAADELDVTADELALFAPAARVTAADRAGRRDTLARRLDSSLFLAVRKPRTAHAWALPQGSVDAADGGSLRAAAERELREECGSALRVHFYGNAPLFRVAYEHDAAAAARLGADVTQLFIFPALYVAGEPELEADGELDGFEWLAHDELHERLAPDLADSIVELTSHDFITETSRADIERLLELESVEQ